MVQKSGKLTSLRLVVLSMVIPTIYMVLYILSGFSRRISNEPSSQYHIYDIPQVWQPATQLIPPC